VGAIGSYSGAFAANQGGIPSVLAAWASSVNAAGGINGHKVKVIARAIAVDGATPYFESSTPAQKAYRAALSKYAPNIAGQPLDNSWSR
jgi:hypothetical protein